MTTNLFEVCSAQHTAQLPCVVTYNSHLLAVFGWIAERKTGAKASPAKGCKISLPSAMVKLAEALRFLPRYKFQGPLDITANMLLLGAARDELAIAAHGYLFYFQSDPVRAACFFDVEMNGGLGRRAVAVLLTAAAMLGLGWNGYPIQRCELGAQEVLLETSGGRLFGHWSMMARYSCEIGMLRMHLERAAVQAKCRLAGRELQTTCTADLPLSTITEPWLVVEQQKLEVVTEPEVVTDHM